MSFIRMAAVPTWIFDFWIRSSSLSMNFFESFCVKYLVAWKANSSFNFWSRLIQRIAERSSFFVSWYVLASASSSRSFKFKLETTGSVNELILIRMVRSILMNKLELRSCLNAKLCLDINFSSAVFPGYPVISFWVSSRITVSPFQLPMPFACSWIWRGSAFFLNSSKIK